MISTFVVLYLSTFFEDRTDSYYLDNSFLRR